MFTSEQFSDEQFVREQFSEGRKSVDYEQRIGFQIRVLAHQMTQIRSLLDRQSQETPVSGMQGWVIGYLYANRDREVYQRDVQNQFSLGRSTVAGLLKAMERDGLITRASVEQDARLKKLTLTPKALKMHEEVIAHMDQVEEMLGSALTPEEKDAFLRLCGKIRGGLEAHCGEKT